MNKFQIAYLSGITFVSIGLIPIARSIFSIELFNDAPIFFLAGGIWLLLIIVFLYSSKESQRQFPTRRNSQQHPQLLSPFWWFLIKFICNISKHYSNKSSGKLKFFHITRALLSNVIHCRNNYAPNLFFSFFLPCLHSSVIYQ